MSGELVQATNQFEFTMHGWNMQAMSMKELHPIDMYTSGMHINMSPAINIDISD